MPRPKEPLIKADQTFATALKVIDRDGLEGFNLRRLAQELGVNPSSLYHHFADKNEILNGVCQLVLKRSGVWEPLRLRADATWQDYVRKSVALYRRALVQHPNVAPLMVPNGPLGRFGDSLGRRGVAELISEGVPSKYIYAIVESINSLVYGSAQLSLRAIDQDAEIRYGDDGGSALSEVFRKSPRSPDRLFEMQIEALLQGWTTVLEQDAKTDSAAAGVDRIRKKQHRRTT
jgi:TetR/AcrR family tetracycline transcriptional repressor